MTTLVKARDYLRKPYPFYYEGRDLWILLISIGFMSILFLYLFQPFEVNTNEHKMSFFGITMVHTLVGVVLFLLGSLTLKLVLTGAESWTVGKDILFLTIVVFVIGVGQFLIRDLIYDNPNNWSLQYFIEEVRNAFLIGILFVLILVPLNHNRLQRHNIKRATGIQNIHTKATHPAKLPIKTHLKQDDFELDPSTLIFAKADRNYVEIHILENDKIVKHLKRLSLANLEKQLQDLTYIVKTHRSYLVNLQFIKSISGNAQGYSLTLNRFDKPILVSRKMIPSFEKRLRQVT